MATVLLPYTYVKGSVLDPAGHNRNAYSLTPGDGVYSELNGGVAGVNLVSSFQVTSELVQPEQVTFARADGAVSTLDNMGDVNLCDQDNSVDKVLASQALPGCGLRIFLPFDATMLLWEVSFFWHCSRFTLPGSIIPIDGGSGIKVSSLILTKLSVDGVMQDYTRREYPPTLFQNFYDGSFVGPGLLDAGGNERDASEKQELRTTERAMSQHRDISHLALSSSEVSAGWHEMFLGFYVQPRGSVQNPLVLDDVRGYSGEGDTATKEVQVECRLTVGCRNARVLAVL